MVKILLKFGYLKQIIMLVLANSFSTKCNNLIYILEWTSAAVEPLNYLGAGQEAFKSENCSYQNCYLTDNRLFFNSIINFDVLLFNAVFLNDSTHIPPIRSEVQEYVLIGLEPAGIYKIPAIFNNFFNITWTYKLSSDVPYPYIIVKNNRSDVIGPKENMQWIHVSDMVPTNVSVLSKIQNKSIAAAWIASNCENAGDRLTVVKNLERELAVYGHRIDIFGKCGNFVCPKGKRMKECYSTIESDYYFYLAFENSLCEDYVTEKLLHALQHFAVPVVYGGANYTRFMPDEIYLNAQEFGAQGLAKKMDDIIRDPQIYFNFFKWHGYYSFRNSDEDNYHDAICGFCALLNNKTRRHQRTAYKYITKWWNGENESSNIIDITPDIVNDMVEKPLKGDESGFISSLSDFLFDL